MSDPIILEVCTTSVLRNVSDLRQWAETVNRQHGYCVDADALLKADGRMLLSHQDATCSTTARATTTKALREGEGGGRSLSELQLRIRVLTSRLEECRQALKPDTLIPVEHVDQLFDLLITDLGDMIDE